MRFMSMVKSTEAKMSPPPKALMHSPQKARISAKSPYVDALAVAASTLNTSEANSTLNCRATNRERVRLPGWAHSACQNPRRSVLAASSALASSGPAPTCGVAQPWRTSQVERSWLMTLHRAANSFDSRPGARVQATAR